MQGRDLKISLVRPSELTVTDLALWREFRGADPSLDSPYFAPEFTLAVATVRNDVRVAVLERQGETVGFFPFQRGAFGIGKPVGGHMSDYHGVIARAGSPWSAAEIVRGCGLAIWDFDHVPASQYGFKPHQHATAASPYIDLSEGYDAYFRSRAHSKSSTLRQMVRRIRRMTRERGEIRYVRHVDNPEVLRTLLAWKSAQFVRTEVPNVLSMRWTRDLLIYILAQNDPAFRGELSVLYVGEQIAAIDLLLRSNHVLHSWFGHFDQQFGRYSPGHVLLLKTAEDGPSRGIRYIDLGKGGGYKLHFMSDAFPLIEGSVSCDRAKLAVRQLCRKSAALIRASPLRPTARAIGTLARPLRNWIAFR